MKDSFRIDNMLGLQVFPPPPNLEWVFFFLLCKIYAEIAADKLGKISSLWLIIFDSFIVRWFEIAFGFIYLGIQRASLA